MNKTQQLMQDAIDGGYEEYDYYLYLPKFEERMTLDPKFWQAVGKTRGWGYEHGIEFKNMGFFGFPWQSRMFWMIDHIIEGGTITSYIETL